MSNFKYLCVLQGVFLRKPGGASVLTQLGHLFDETPAQLRSACERAAAAQASGAPAQAPAASAGSNGAGCAANGSAPEQAAANQWAEPATKPAAAGAAADSAQSRTDSMRQSAAAAAQPQAATARSASELLVVREGSMELDYGSDYGESELCCHLDNLGLLQLTGQKATAQPAIACCLVPD